MSIAHSEAIRRNSRVVLCQSADGVSCANSGGWSQGWIVFDDANGDGVRGTQEQLIVRVPEFSRSLRLTGTMDAVRAVSFNATDNARAAASLMVWSEASGPAQARQVTLQA
jgi:type IV fimbrial biogenesis protein FimT